MLGAISKLRQLDTNSLLWYNVTVKKEYEWRVASGVIKNNIKYNH